MTDYYIDAQMGVAGDMMLAAFLDLYPALIDGTVAAMERGGGVIGAIAVEVKEIAERPIEPHHGDGHLFGGKQLVIQEEGGGPTDVPALREAFQRGCDAAGLSTDGARRFATAMFDTLTAAESTVHDQPRGATHLHELAAPDTFADLIGLAYLYEQLRLWESAVFCTPITTGSGVVETAHGTLPVPPPATLELLKGLPWRYGAVAAELATPTGVVMLKRLVSSFDTNIEFEHQQVGYGYGTRRIDRYTNALRIIAGASATQCWLVETGVDDVTGEQLGWLVETLEALAPVKDIAILNAVTKKNRPSYLIRVLTSDIDSTIEALVNATGTLGVRIFSVRRQTLDRELHPITCCGRSLQVKIARFRGRVINYKIEADDLRSVIEASNEPPAMVRRRVERAALKQLEQLQPLDAHDENATTQ